MASRGGNPSSGAPNHRRQRSLSVSAASRRTVGLLSDDDVPSQFSNKRENPLFWAAGTRADPHSSLDKKFYSESVPLDTASKVLTGSRGRSVTRNLGLGNEKEPSRSLSVVRPRSVSRGRYGRSTPGSDAEQKSGISTLNGSNYNLSVNNAKKANSAKDGADSPSQMRTIQVQANRHPTSQCSEYSASKLKIRDWDDSISTGSLSEAEEKTIRAVSEQMKSVQGNCRRTSGTAVRLNNATSIASTSFADIAPDLVNTEAVELVLDIRSEYARKLQESQERAVKLRADLAVEEHLGQDLNRILKELLPDPKSSAAQRFPKRRTSNERKKMSKQLTEDAMAYFDECVSISTFDSSDFSAPEDQPLNSVGASVLGHDSASVKQTMQNVSAFFSPSNCLNHRQDSVSHNLLDTCGESCFTANSSSHNPMINPASQNNEDGVCDRKLQFYGIELQEEIRNFVKHFDDDIVKNDTNAIRLKCYDLEEYNSRGQMESLLFERVVFNRRIGSGSLHMCGGGFELSFPPFASFI